MSTIKLSFKNRDGVELSAKLELPNDQKAHSYAIFAHCFTCSKNFSAVRNIAKCLNDAGIAVLRFDFTGLGESDGDFAESNFSSNVDDIIDAAKFLKQEYQSPSLLIGHSLGGAAVIYAASKLDSVKAYATIGAPASPEHIKHLFDSELKEIEEKGEAVINLAGQKIKIKKQFIDDVSSQNLKAVLSEMRKPILVIHSPQDTIVGIENAKEIYLNAFHPKSFISIDKADHLLSKKEDSKYVGELIAGWAKRYLNIPEKEVLKSQHEVAVSIGNAGFTTTVLAGKHYLTADEPESVGGNDFGPSPYEYVSSGLGACTAMTLRMYADRKKWDLQKVVVHINHGKDYPSNIDEIEKTTKKIDVFEREIELYGDLDDAQKQRLLEIADKCPVHRTLHASSEIKTSLK